jgi:type I restriction enzyme, S subunit
MLNLITENIDIWTSAQTTRTNGRGKSVDNQSKYGIKKLRELILELAVRGKLVPQDPKDEPASVLLEKIAKEKTRLIKEDKIKKEKPLPEITDDEKPFGLPNGWEWLRLGNIFDIQDYLRIPVSISERQLRVGPYPYYGANGQVGFIDNYIFEGERVLIAEDGGFFDDPIRGVAYIANGKFWVNNHAHVLECLGGTCAKFWLSFFNRMDWEPLVRGMTRAKLNQAVMVQIPLALPPLSEQHRIVAKVDELMALCDKLEQRQADSNIAHQTLVETLLATLTDTANHGEFIKAWQRIEECFGVLFTTEYSIDKLKQTILQLAVMGKLVPQDPSDEPASILLEKIAKEKSRLIKEGKIKKEKPLPEISEEEKPFKLPNIWMWVRWNSIAMKIGDIDHKMPEEVKDGFPYVSPRDFLPDNKINLMGAKKISTDDFLRLAEKIQPQKGDIIYPRYGTIGENRLVATEKDFLASYSCCVIKTMHNFIEPKYQFIFSISILAENQAKQAENKTTQANVGIKSIQNYLAPLPPLAEQHRIVAKVDELMALCDSLKARVNDAQTIQVQLADAIVEQAVA